MSRQQERIVATVSRIEKAAEAWADARYQEGLDDGRGTRMRVTEKPEQDFRAAMVSLRRALEIVPDEQPTTAKKR